MFGQLWRSLSGKKIYLKVDLVVGGTGIRAFAALAWKNFETMDHADWSNLFQMQTTRGRSLLESVAADELRRNVLGPQVRLRLRGSAISEIRYSSESSWRWQFLVGAVPNTARVGY